MIAKYAVMVLLFSLRSYYSVPGVVAYVLCSLILLFLGIALLKNQTFEFLVYHMFLHV